VINTTRNQKDRLFAHLEVTGYEDLKAEVEQMTPEKVSIFWELLKPSFNTVGLISGRGGRGRSSWTSLYRKMALFMRKAEEV
jgi:hypothetical protein